MEQVEQRVGNYRLLQLLGTGAFAEVYLGEHLYLNTPVALKVVRAQVQESTLASFLSEARHVSHLVHPHVSRVFHFGLEAQLRFLVMDYAPFGNLRQLHPAGTSVPLPTLVSYVTALASALQHVHDQHLLHRDLKPENVLLGAKHEVLLSDFGLAVLAAGSEAVPLPPRFGPLAYMAPEQMQGQACPASDQYALAVMVYEWLSGQRPFVGSAARLWQQQLYAAPPPLCERYPTIPQAVEQVVFKGLCKEPAQRFVDVLSFATAFAQACQAVSAVSLAARPALVAPSSPAGRPSSSEDRRERLRPVPLPLTPLLGREPELQATRELLRRPEVRLLTLSGPAGIGKTHLALCLASEVQQALTHGACLVSLAALTEPAEVLPAILEALGLPARAEGSQPLEQLKACLRQQQLLLLLDAFEPVLPAAPLLAELLASCPQLKLLVTSRALLHVGGEYAYALAPLEVPDLYPLPPEEELVQVASVALFVQRVQALLPGFQLTPANARAIAQLCRRLEGVPLALELAAARTNLLPPQALLARLQAGFEVLTAGRRDAPMRQQTLRQMLRGSYEGLSPEEQTLFRRLAVFVGGCTLPAAEAVAAALGEMTISVLDGVASLLDHSLLRALAPEQQELRLSPLEMMRAYGLEQLAASGELEAACDAHAAYYLAWAQEVESVGEQGGWPQRREAEQGNLRTALWWLLERHEGEAALRLAAAMRPLWVQVDAVSEGRSALAHALEVCQQRQVVVAAAVRAKVLYVAGWLACWQQDAVQGRPLLEESLALYRCLEDGRGAAMVQSCLCALRGEGEEGEAAGTQGQQGSRDGGEFAQSGVRRGHEELTAREGEVLQWLAMGMSNSQIAERLVLSRHTVNAHVQAIYRKLGLNSRSAATRYALEHQLS